MSVVRPRAKRGKFLALLASLSMIAAGVFGAALAAPASAQDALPSGWKNVPLSNVSSPIYANNGGFYNAGECANDLAKTELGWDPATEEVWHFVVTADQGSSYNVASIKSHLALSLAPTVDLASATIVQNTSANVLNFWVVVSKGHTLSGGSINVPNAELVNNPKTRFNLSHSCPGNNTPPVDPCLEDPTAAECQPVDPCLEDPTAAECQPVDPCLEDPTAAECQPVDPCLEDPTAAECQPVDPCLEDPTAAECQPVDPCLEDPTAAECQPVDPCLEDPTAAECQPVDPCLEDPTAAECQPVDPCLEDPTAAECRPVDPCLEDPNAEGCTIPDPEPQPEPEVITYRDSATLSASQDICTVNGTLRVDVKGNGLGESTISQREAKKVAEGNAQLDLEYNLRMAKAQFPGATDGACAPVTTAVVEPAVVEAPAAVALPEAATVQEAPQAVAVPAAATVPTSVPAGEGPNGSGFPAWALVLIVAGAAGAALSGALVLKKQ